MRFQRTNQLTNPIERIIHARVHELMDLLLLSLHSPEADRTQHDYNDYSDNYYSEDYAKGYRSDAQTRSN